uniref:Uncharacterized protein n=1 Tax=Cucumis melo TaxID=3656 RepID=A0A9I9ECP3_CUCME
MHSLLFPPDAQMEKIRYHESLGKVIRHRAHKAGYCHHSLMSVVAGVFP